MGERTDSSMCRCMEGWTDGLMDGKTDGGMDGWRDGRMEGWTDGGMDGWRDGRMEGWTDRGMDGQRDGRIEGWTDGGMDGCRDGGMDGWRDGRMDVWHEGLLFKLKENGITGSLLKLFENYLHNRKQRVVLNGSSSDYSEIESGVPQGSILGLLLFHIYINDLERNIKSNIRFLC